MLEETLHSDALPTPDSAQLSARLERFDPDDQAKDKCENTACNNHPPLQLEPKSTVAEHQTWNGERKGGKDQYGVSEAGCISFSVHCINFY